MGNLFTKKILIAILVVLIGIAASLAWMVKDRQTQNTQEDAAYEQHLAFKAQMSRQTVEEVRAQEALDGGKKSFFFMPSH